MEGIFPPFSLSDSLFFRNEAPDLRKSLLLHFFPSPHTSHSNNGTSAENIPKRAHTNQPHVMRPKTAAATTKAESGKQSMMTHTHVARTHQKHGFFSHRRPPARACSSRNTHTHTHTAFFLLIPRNTCTRYIHPPFHLVLSLILRHATATTTHVNAA